MYPPYEGRGDYWYCADFCAPGRCEEGEVCELLPTPCPAFWVPCPLVAACYDKCSEGCEANEVREYPVSDGEHHTPWTMFFRAHVLLPAPKRAEIGNISSRAVRKRVSFFMLESTLFAEYQGFDNR